MINVLQKKRFRFSIDVDTCLESKAIQELKEKGFDIHKFKGAMRPIEMVGYVHENEVILPCPVPPDKFRILHIPASDPEVAEKYLAIQKTSQYDRKAYYSGEPLPRGTQIWLNHEWRIL